MKCKYCGNKLKGVYCDDYPNQFDDGDYAFNILVCVDGCLAVFRHSVWDKKGVKAIPPLRDADVVRKERGNHKGR